MSPALSQGRVQRREASGGSQKLGKQDTTKGPAWRPRSKQRPCYTSESVHTQLEMEISELPSPETQSLGKTPALLPRLERGLCSEAGGGVTGPAVQKTQLLGSSSKNLVKERAVVCGQGFSGTGGLGEGSGGQAWEARPCIHPTALN